MTKYLNLQKKYQELAITQYLRVFYLPKTGQFDKHKIINVRAGEDIKRLVAE